VSRAAEFRDLLSPHASGEELDRLVDYAELLERWSGRHSLVSWKSREELVRRHLLDALAARELMGPAGALLDVGSGAGLPGIPLLAVNPSWTGVLLEPRQKRWAFLRQAIRELGLQAEVRRVRFQEDDGSGGPFQIITVRALGGYEELLEWAPPHLSRGGRVLVWGTDQAFERLSKLPRWRVLSSPLPSLDRGQLVQLERCFT
jgi:16S rRNA (guanine527-N7)-methyltransferase